MEREIVLPVTQPSCPAFGGAALDRLYVTTAHEHLTPEMRRMQPLAGGLFAAGQSDVRGLPEVRFAGIF